MSEKQVRFGSQKDLSESDNVGNSAKEILKQSKTIQNEKKASMQEYLDESEEPLV